MLMRVRHLAIPMAALLGWLLSTLSPAPAQGPAPADDGLFITVPNPITTEVVRQIKEQVLGRVGNAAHPVHTVVFDFNPGGKDVTNADYGGCWGLAQFINGLRGTTTVAFVHAKATGHTALPVLACGELVMSKGASLGEILTDGVDSLGDDQRLSYSQFTPHRKPQFAAIQKMFDKDMVLAKGINGKDGQIWYFDQKSDDAKKLGLAGTEKVDFVQGGRVALYTADQARAIGLCKAIAETREELAEVYSLPPSSTKDDPLRGRTPDPYRFTLTGDVDGAMRESVNRIIKHVKGKKGNVLILTLNCGGVDLGAARALADDLVEAQTGDDGLKIIAYIPDQAPDAATFLAFGCTEIVMSRRKDVTETEQEATLGDFQASLKGVKKDMVERYRESLRELADKRGGHDAGILVDGMFDPDLVIVRVQRKNDRTLRRLMLEAEFEADKANWTVIKQVKPKGQLLKLNASLAEELRVARYTVETRDPAGVYALYGFDPAKVKEVAPGWIDRFAEFLRRDVVTVMLVVIGFTGLILELKVPGLTVPGIIAALCFILVFWSQSRFSGEMFVLALLLFILGLVLVGLEIFVLPGLGAPGIFGVLCMLGGLGLVTFERMPQTTDDWGLLGFRVAQYMFGMLGAFGLAFGIARFLPKVPYANRLMLAPPSDGPGSSEQALPGAEAAAGLFGAIGTANTTLRPAGVVRFGDEFVDVVSDGGFVPAGTRVRVIAVEGTRIVVKEV